MQANYSLSLQTVETEETTHPVLLYIQDHAISLHYQWWKDKATGLYYRTFDVNLENGLLDVEMGTKICGNFDELDEDYINCIMQVYNALTAN